MQAHGSQGCGRANPSCQYGRGLAIVGGQRAAAPVLSGVVPPLADSYFPRPETGFGLADGLRPGETVVLANAETGGAPGVGKTQLAVGFAHTVWNNRAV